MGPARNTREKTKKLFNKVFGLELLREMVLDYVIHDKEKDKAISNIRSCRLVCKDWLRSISRILLQYQKPLFWFRDTGQNWRNGEILSEFAIAVSEPSRLHERVPPFAIEADSELLDKENCQLFSNFLVECASGLVELKLSYDDESAFVLNANMSLPKLRKFKITKEGENKDSSKHNEFIQSVVNACEELKCLKVMDYTDYQYPPQTFELQPSLSELMLYSIRADPEKLLINLVPTLKVLVLDRIDIAWRDGLISSILEKVKKTLERFDIRLEEQARSSQKQPMTFRLPLMEKLKRLKISCELETFELEQNFSALEQLVPVLSNMTLNDHAVSAFRKWTDRSCFHSVKTLHVSLRVWDVDHEGNFVTGRNFDLSEMESLKRAFPNVRELCIQILGPDKAVFAFIMKEMRNLRILRIYVRSSPDLQNDDIPKEFWDALLLDVPEESVVALKISPKLWETMQEESTVSIRNMAALETLELACCDVNDMTLFEISSAVFQHALFHMPNLTKLAFKEIFWVSDEMQQAWRDRGRVIEIEN